MRSSHTPRIVYWRLRSSCLHSVEFFSGTDLIVALCSVRKFISSRHPSLVSKLCSYSYIQCIHISHLFGNNAIRKGLFYSVTVLPTVLADQNLTLSKFRPWVILPTRKYSLSHFLRVFGPVLYCLLESSRKDQLLRPHSCMPTYNLLASCVMCALCGGILTPVKSLICS